MPKKDLLGEQISDRFGGVILDYIRDNLPNLPRIVITGTPLEGGIGSGWEEPS